MKNQNRCQCEPLTVVVSTGCRTAIEIESTCVPRVGDTIALHKNLSGSGENQLFNVTGVEWEIRDDTDLDELSRFRVNVETEFVR